MSELKLKEILTQQMKMLLAPVDQMENLLGMMFCKSLWWFLQKFKPKRLFQIPIENDCVHTQYDTHFDCLCKSLCQPMHKKYTTTQNRQPRSVSMISDYLSLWITDFY